MILRSNGGPAPLRLGPAGEGGHGARKTREEARAGNGRCLVLARGGLQQALGVDRLAVLAVDPLGDELGGDLGVKLDAEMVSGAVRLRSAVVVGEQLRAGRDADRVVVPGEPGPWRDGLGLC